MASDNCRGWLRHGTIPPCVGSGLRWRSWCWVRSGGGGWNINSADGQLIFQKSNVSNGDAVALTGAWQLEGDFDLRVDFLIAGVPNGGRGMLVGYGPAEMGAFVPTLLGLVYQ